MKINYKSDFDFILRMKDCKDEDKTVPFPECDFDALFWTSSKAKAYAASYRDGIYTNCFRTEDGGMHFVFNDHRMGMGILRWEPHFDLPNDIYPDGIQDLFRKAALGIELVDGDGDCPTTAEIEALLPYIKGDAFTYADFTSEQIADLKRPATEAAERLDSFVRTASEAETKRAANEKSRVSAEGTRVSQEQARVSAEETRVADETKRREAETERSKAEEARKTAETKRATEFATWERKIDGKAEKSELSNIVGTPAEEVIENIEPTLVTEALRKVPQTLTPEEQAQVKANLAISKMELFDDMWRAAVGVWGDIDHSHMEDGVNKPYYLNELWLTYEEAMRIYALTQITSNNCDFRLYGVNIKVRTNLPIQTSKHGNGLDPNSTGYFCIDNNTIEVLNVLVAWTTPYGNQYERFCIMSNVSTIFNCPKLRKVIGPISIYRLWNGNVNVINNNPELEGIQIYNLNGTVNLRLEMCPKLNLASFKYIVQNRWGADSGMATVTVHPSVYSKLTDESNTEWHQVLLEAADKNITFATT